MICEKLRANLTDYEIEDAFHCYNEVASMFAPLTDPRRRLFEHASSVGSLKRPLMFVPAFLRQSIAVLSKCGTFDYLRPTLSAAAMIGDRGVGHAIRDSIGQEIRSATAAPYLSRVEYYVLRFTEMALSPLNYTHTDEVLFHLRVAADHLSWVCEMEGKEVDRLRPMVWMGVKIALAAVERDSLDV